MSTIADILAIKPRDVYTIEPDATVYDAIAAMADHGIGALLVVEGTHLLGIITERDYLRKVALQGRSSRTTPVREIMSTRLVCVTPDQDVTDAMAIMTEARVRHLPVLDGTGLGGIVSIGDCVKQISSDREAHIRYLTDYIRDDYPR